MSSKSKKAGNLVALGSAAVVAVYGAGFMRTAAAAERFAEQSDERVLSPEDAAAAQAEMKSATTLPVANDSNNVSHGARAQSGVAASQTVPTQAAAPPINSAPNATVNKADATIAKVDAKTQTANAPSIARNVSVPIPPEVTTGSSSPGGTPAHAAAPVGATGATVSTDTKPAADKPSSSLATTTTSAPVTAPAAPTPIIAAPPPAVVAAPVAPPVAAPVAPTTTEAPATSSAPAKLKDGEYTGYGTSRHGDVEVYLETTDGKITYVKISQCLTQYSCSWISDLPKQVLARQSPRVDGVSGATQSANAFYYAVVQALAKAK